MAGYAAAVSVETEHLGLFRENGEQYVHSLQGIASAVFDARRRVTSATGDGPVGKGLAVDSAFDELLASAGRCNLFVGTVADALATAGAGLIDRALWSAGLLELHDPALSATRRASLESDVLSGVPANSPIAEAILSRQIPAPTDTTRDRVAAAMTHGLTPAQVGIDARYFPLSYQAAVDRFQRLPLEGTPVFSRRDDPAGHDSSARFFGAERLAALADFGLIVTDKGVGGDHQVLSEADQNRLLSVQVTGSHLGQRWQGRTLADMYRIDRPTDPFGLDPGGHDPATIHQLASQLTDSPQVAASFFNTLGVRETAGLPSVHPREARWGNADPATIREFSEALAGATHTGQLTFTGRDVIEQQEPGYWAPHVSLLFTRGGFDRDFLVGAAVAQLERHGNADRLDNSDFGPSATNILLNQVLASDGAGAQIIEALGADGAHHYLQPKQPFRPTQTGDAYPITLLLGAVGRDPALASLVLAATARLRGGLSDAGVAAGIDAIMATHPTIMYDSHYLKQRGIGLNGRLSQGDWAALGFGGQEWKHLRSLVLEHGQGIGLAAATNGLIVEAISHDLADGRLGEQRDFYELLALNSGALDEQWFQRLLEIRTEQDADGVRRNGYAAAGISIGVALAAGAALPVMAAGTVVGTGVSAASSLGLAQWPIDHWETDTTEAELRRRLAEQRGISRLWQDAVVTTLVRTAQEAGQPIRFESGNILTIEHTGGTPMLVSTNPRTGERRENPTIDWHPDGRVGDERNDTTSEIHAHYARAQDLIDPSRRAENETEVRRLLLDWIEIPEQPEA